MPNSINPDINLPVLPKPDKSKHTSMLKTNPSSSSKDLKTVCQDFESLFVHYMLKQMRRNVPENKLFSGGSAEQLYTSMLDGELAKLVSRQRGIGLGQVIFRQMSNSSDGTQEK